MLLSSPASVPAPRQPANWAGVGSLLHSAAGDIQTGVAQFMTSESVGMHGYHRGGPSEYDEGQAASVSLSTAAGKVSAAADMLTDVGDPQQGAALGAAELTKTADAISSYAAAGEGLPVSQLRQVSWLEGRVEGLGTEADGLAQQANTEHQAALRTEVPGRDIFASGS